MSGTPRAAGVSTGWSSKESEIIEDFRSIEQLSRRSQLNYYLSDGKIPIQSSQGSCMEGHAIPSIEHTSLAVRVRDPITGRIIKAGASFSAVDTFRAFYQLESLRAQTRLL
jgi:hypothetical protein